MRDYVSAHECAGRVRRFYFASVCITKRARVKVVKKEREREWKKARESE